MTKTLESSLFQDSVAGIGFAALGSVTTYFSFDYMGASGLYPRMLGIIIAALGLLLVFRSFLRVKNKEPQARPIIDSPSNFFKTLPLVFLYLLLVPLIGFYTSSLLILLSLPFALGFRRVTPLIISSALFIGFLYVLFTLVLEKPLPREFFQI